MKRTIALLTFLCMLLAGCELPGMGIGTDTGAPAVDQTEEQGTPVLDENGNRIGTVVFYYDENGVVLKEELKFDDGSHVLREYEYNSDGTKIKCEYEHSDGSSGVETFYENGSLQTSTVFYADGTKIENGYFENGSLQWNSVVYMDGSKTESTYFDNGKQKTTLLVCLDGTVIETTFHENGVMASFMADGPCGLYELNYAEDGAPVGVEREVGTPNSFHAVDVSGDVAGVQTKEYNGDGYLCKVVTEYEDLSRFEEAYFDNGMTEYRKLKDASGRIEWYFYDNGTVRNYKRVADTINYSAVFLPDGKFGQQRIVDYDADIIRELTYDISGIILDISEADLS